MYFSGTEVGLGRREGGGCVQPPTRSCRYAGCIHSKGCFQRGEKRHIVYIKAGLAARIASRIRYSFSAFKSHP